MNLSYMTIEELIVLADTGSEEALYEIGRKVVAGSRLVIEVTCPDCEAEFEVEP